MPSISSKLRFSSHLDYKARYTVSKMNSAGDVINNYTLTIEIPGYQLRKFGINNTISHYAIKHDLAPDSYLCEIIED